MANKFEIHIVALDRATAVVRQVSRALNRITAPVSRLKASMRSLSAELGLDRIGKGLVDVGRNALDVTRIFTGMLTPLSALLGFSTVAGIIGLGKAWATAGWNVTSAAKAIGESIPKLQAFQGAGKLVGIEVEATNASLGALMNTLQDARFGRNATALQMMNQLGVKFRLTKDGAVDVVRSFEDIARAVANPKIARNPAVQGLLARTFGIEQMLPLLRQGPAGINKLMEAVRKSGYVMDETATRHAAELQQKLFLLDLTATGLRNTIGDRLTPVVGPLVERLTQWVQANRDLIATKVADAVDALSRALASINWGGIVDGTQAFIGSVQKAVDFVGGWQNALLILVGIMNAQAILAVLNLTKAVWGLGAAFTGTMLKGIGSFALALSASVIGPVAAAEAAVGGLAGALTIAATALGALGFAAAGALAGGALGWLISKATEGNVVGDKIGSGIAKTLAFFGNDEAQAAVNATEGGTTPAGRGPVAASPYRKPAASASSAPAAAPPGTEPTRIELTLRGLPQGVAAVMTSGSTPVNLRIGDAMPTELTP